MNGTRIVLSVIALCCALAAVAAAAEKPAATPRIQIALLLDTSNSMDGLIEQAKTQLWKIVNEFVTVEKDGKRPELQIALFEYGNDGLEASDGYIRLVLPLTTDLDKVSEQLFALTTNGGTEYCGQVIKVAADTLEWSAAADDYKVLFIAGNEPFTQGEVDYRESCKAAITKGIIVNTIHCGSFDEGVQGKWQNGAMLADGSYMSIDQNAEVVHIEAPQDVEIARLGTELNETYVPYGALGEEKSENQAEQDVNAAAAPGSGVQRSVTKASGNYRNADWDLVDALKEGTVKLDEVKAEDLPEAMQKMSAEERQAYVDAKAKARAELQSKVQELNDARNTYVAEEMRKRAESGEEQTLDAAMIKAIREQAQERNFKLE